LAFAGFSGRISFLGSLCGDRFGFLSERSAELQLGSVQRIEIPFRPSWSSAFLQKASPALLMEQLVA